MQGIIRAVARLAVMGLVMAAVLAASVYAGIATTTAIALGIVIAGAVGLVGVARRPRRTKLSAHDEIAAMMAPPQVAAPPPVSNSQRTAVEAMAPPRAVEQDPEALMPRWRRPSLLEARLSDYSRLAPANRMPLRFSGNDADLDLRIVRYAVVPVLDRPDEVLGIQQGDLAAGDEVQVLNTSGAYIEVLCPNGDQGWVHRTTLGQRGGVELNGAGRSAMPKEADDALTALLSARGLI